MAMLIFEATTLIKIGSVYTVSRIVPGQWTLYSVLVYGYRTVLVVIIRPWYSLS